MKLFKSLINSGGVILPSSDDLEVEYNDVIYGFNSLDKSELLYVILRDPFRFAGMRRACNLKYYLAEKYVFTIGNTVLFRHDSLKCELIQKFIEDRVQTYKKHKKSQLNQYDIKQFTSRGFKVLYRIKETCSGYQSNTLSS